MQVIFPALLLLYFSVLFVVENKLTTWKNKLCFLDQF